MESPNNASGNHLSFDNVTGGLKPSTSSNLSFDNVGDQKPKTMTIASTGSIDYNVITVWDALKSKRFYHLAILLYFGLFFGLYMASVYKLAA